MAATTKQQTSTAERAQGASIGQRPRRSDREVHPYLAGSDEEVSGQMAAPRRVNYSPWNCRSLGTYNKPHCAP